MMLPTKKARQQPERSTVGVPRVLYIGDREALDFQPARRRLSAESACGKCSVTDVSDVNSALALLRGQSPHKLQSADVLILAQRRPGELNPADVNRLQRSAPLAATVVLCGAWCEGEARSGHPVPGSSQVSWHQFPPRWVRHRTAWQQGRPTEWSLPATWREEDRLLHLHSVDERWRRPSIDAAIVVPCSGVVRDDWLATMAVAQNWQVVPSSQTAELRELPAIGIWPTDELDAARLNELASFVKQVSPLPVIAIAGFPRPEDDVRIRAVGADALIAKPLLVDDLVAEVTWILEMQKADAVNRRGRS